jgi:hypothetical protein
MVNVLEKVVNAVTWWRYYNRDPHGRSAVACFPTVEKECVFIFNHKVQFQEKLSTL